MAISYQQDFYGTVLVYVYRDRQRIAQYQPNGDAVDVTWYDLANKAGRGQFERFPDLATAHAVFDAYERGLDIAPWGEASGAGPASE